MNLFSMHNSLSSFLSGDMKAETEKMLETLGFVPKDQAASKPEADPGQQIKPEDIEKIKADARAEGEAAGKAEGEKAGAKAATDRAEKILGMCDTAGLPSTKAVELIKSEKSDDELHKEVTNARADAGNKQNISSTVSATGVGEKNPVLEDAQKRAEAAKAAKQ